MRSSATRGARRWSSGCRAGSTRPPSSPASRSPSCCRKGLGVRRHGHDRCRGADLPRGRRLRFGARTDHPAGCSSIPAAQPFDRGALPAFGARHGEPLSGRSLPAGAGTMRWRSPMPRPRSSRHRSRLWLRHPFRNPAGKQEAGKQLVNSDAARVLALALVAESPRDRIVAATSAGHLLMFSWPSCRSSTTRRAKADRDPEAETAAGERVAGIAVVAEGKGKSPSTPASAS